VTQDSMWARSRRIMKSEGSGALFSRIYHRVVNGGYQNVAYKKWQMENERRSPAEIKRQVSTFTSKPKMSIIVPVYNSDPVFLDDCIESVVGQYYEDWELCLYDDASTRIETLECLERWSARNDDRIKVAFGKENRHISASSNEAIKMSSGEYIGFLDHDDELSLNALSEIAGIINDHPDAELIYSDEDKIDEAGNRSMPFFKPDWSPELLMSVNYINHFCVIRREAGNQAGWFRLGYEGAQDHDLFLRISRQSGNIYHVPKILYHWRAVEGSTAMDVNEKEYCGDAGVKSISDMLAANGESATVEAGAIPTEYIVRYKVNGTPRISIIIPFRDEAGLLKNCLDRLLETSSYPDYEIILISNNSEEAETLEYLDGLDDPRVRIFNRDIPFNYSKINNWAAEQATGEYLLFLNNDTEVITSTWIEDMLGYAQRPEIGAVGSKLLFRDGTIQHSGVILGIGGFADHIFAGVPENTGTAFGRDTWSRNYLAVTAACLMVKKEKFESVGGFDEEFVVCGSDVELCLRLYKAGYRNVYLAFVKLYHYEAQTRRSWVDPKDIECSKIHYAEFLQNGDPYYNENLSLDRADGNSLRELTVS